MKTGELQQVLMMVGNSIVAANKEATPETFGALRDAALEPFGLKDTFSHIEYDPAIVKK